MTNVLVPSTFPDSLTLTKLIQYKGDTKITTFQSSYHGEWTENVFFVIGILSGVNANTTCFDTKKTEMLQIQEGSIVGQRKE